MKHHPKEKDVKGVINLMKALMTGRVFVSMPKTPLTPKWFLEHKNVRYYSSKEGVERYHGIVPLNECPLSPFDHGNLYGDGVFEGILIKHGQVYRLKEHLKRLQRSARTLGISLPYSLKSFCTHILAAANAAGIKKTDSGYIRLVVTRGIGNLGIDPRKCAAPTVYIIVAQVTLYPKERYRTGIHLGINDSIRRPDKSVLDPTVKSLNYINNIQSVRKGVIGAKDKTVMETLELTHRGYVAEASADNLFIVDKSGKKPVLLTAVDDYALQGITRQAIIDLAQKIGIKTIKSATILPEDLLGDNKEVFLTGTAAGVMPIVKFDGKKVGSGKPGAVTKKLINAYNKDRANPRAGLSLKATPAQISRYCR